MGTLYKEIVMHKNLKEIKGVLFLCLGVLFINTIILLSSLRNIFEGFLIVCYAIIPIVAVYMVYSWKRYNERYRYTIIDKELIIEKLNGSKRKPMLNINAKHIVKIEKCKTKKQEEKLCRQYSFLCSGNRKNVYNCIYEKGGKLYGFYFEPSMELYNKLLGMSSSRKIV